ncbi:hypothetical protein CLOP_g22487 [Closterium sp. NIES-67]|nr:hypothetical protein CLOP_g22487 [Closterium sp. NIES-67]
MFGGGEPDEAKAAELRLSSQWCWTCTRPTWPAASTWPGPLSPWRICPHLPYTAMLWASGDSELITSRPNVNKWWERISFPPLLEEDLRPAVTLTALK